MAASLLLYNHTANRTVEECRRGPGIGRTATNSHMYYCSNHAPNLERKTSSLRSDFLPAGGLKLAASLIADYKLYWPNKARSDSNELRSVRVSKTSFDTFLRTLKDSELSTRLRWRTPMKPVSSWFIFQSFQLTFRLLSGRQQVW